MSSNNHRSQPRQSTSKTSTSSSAHSTGSGLVLKVGSPPITYSYATATSSGLNMASGSITPAGSPSIQSFSSELSEPTAPHPTTSTSKPLGQPDMEKSLTTPRRRILFYRRRDPHYGFTNFSTHSVTYNGKRYPTSEHLFQSFKFQGHQPDLAEHIRTCATPSAALSEARRYQANVRSDWRKVNVEKMDETLYQKAFGHGNAELVEDSDKDSFWGIGAGGRGSNQLGKALERLREKLRADR
ncbi:hypothetical protein BDP27DRAFT_1338609 [Rhodocollybia butyracea]|uniref:NADAR domain-containing protein n=1 Tax=Rhodocollybia butyracea TaxID=206335 RepID=A0A9P5P8Y8_9AGAR|nr:hypothetical protein BDP27DRAFT_1338609 [Rhodocollybia butyracea]